jgi:hypothetical protein
LGVVDPLPIVPRELRSRIKPRMLDPAAAAVQVKTAIKEVRARRAAAVAASAAMLAALAEP